MWRSVAETALATGLLRLPCRRVVSMTGGHGACLARYLVMELVSGGELFDRIVEKGSVRRSVLLSALTGAILSPHSVYYQPSQRLLLALTAAIISPHCVSYQPSLRLLLALTASIISPHCGYY